MKKILAVLLTIVLVSTMSAVFVMAEGESSTPVVDINGFEFDIDGVDTAIAGEDGVVITTTEAVATANLKYAVYVQCEKVADNLYKAKTDSVAGDGTVPTLTLTNGDIVIGIHSASSKPEDVSQYPNQPQKVAATNIKAGMYFTLAGIDLAAKTATDATATVSTSDPRTTSSTVSSTASSEVSVAPEYTDIMGETVASPAYVLDVTAPTTYKPGSTINVTITLKNIVPTSGITLVNFMLYYDATKVDPVVINNTETENAEMDAFLKTAPNKAEWEGMSKLEADQSRYDISFLTSKVSAAAKTDGSIVIVVPFKVKAAVAGTIAFQVPHKETNASDVDMKTVYGNAGLALVKLAGSNVSDNSEVITGDAGMIAVALVAVLALAGATTVAVKKRRSR